MCLAIPVQVKSIDGQLAEVEIGGVSRKIGLWLTPEVEAGDYVLVHTGYAINIVDQREALETIRLIKELHEVSR